MKSFRILLLIAILTLAFGTTKASGIKWSAGFGIKTFAILGETANSSPMVQRDSNLAQFIGGGFNQTNSGFSLMGYATIGEEGNIVIPFGFEYYKMISLERIPISKRTTAYLRTTIEVPTATIGFNYKFYKFAFADVKAYVGIELNGFFVQSPEFYRRIEYLEIDSIYTFTSHPKKPASRLGGDIKLGFDGNVYGPVSINASVALGVQNLFFRDDKRGELYTPTRIEESKESLVPVFKIGLMLRYRF
jgi:hypothetical protein